MFTPPPRDQLRPLNDNRQKPDPAQPEADILAPEPAVAASSESRPNFIDDLVMGIRFYSRIPTGQRPHGAPDLSRIALALPFASMLIGLGPALLLVLFVWIGMPPLLGAALCVGLSVLLTGAMSEDGLADVADALPNGDRDKRLQIMKDPTHGTYGVVAIVLLLMIRVAALGAAAVPNPLEAGAIWLAATVMARSGSLWLTLRLPPARAAGVSSAAGRVSRMTFCAGMAFALAIGFVVAGPASGLLAFILAILVAAVIASAWTALCRKLIGGQTGDLIGALNALLEIGILSVFAMFA